MTQTVSLTKEEGELLTVEGIGALENRLNNSLSQLSGRARAIQSRAEDENRSLTSEEARQVDKIVEQFDETDYKIRALKDHFLPLDGVPPRPPKCRRSPSEIKE
jgi:hypothetical protein